MPPSNHESADRYRDEILKGNRIVLSQAITLCESNLTDDRHRSENLVQILLPHSGKSIRIGITGSPGVGKSTFIEAFGMYLTGHGHKVAILTVDPSSQRTKGSILGDKTRMNSLSKNPNAYIRPSPSGDTPGGVGNATRESIILCEAAGFDVILVETVGVGQSETTVRTMVDFFLLLMLAGSGDELQGIKKGIMEMADGIVITKADHQNKDRAERAKIDFTNALHLFQPAESGMHPEVITASAFDKTGIAESWEMIKLFLLTTKENGFFQRTRDHQKLLWFHEALANLLRDKVQSSVAGGLHSVEKDILQKNISPAMAARQLISQHDQLI